MQSNAGRIDPGPPMASEITPVNKGIGPSPIRLEESLVAAVVVPRCSGAESDKTREAPAREDDRLTTLACILLGLGGA